MNRTISALFVGLLLLTSVCNGDELRQMQERLRLLYFYCPLSECESGSLEVIDEIHKYSERGDRVPREILASAYINIYAVYCAKNDRCGRERIVNDYLAMLTSYKYCDHGVSARDVDAFLSNYVKITPPSFLRQNMQSDVDAPK